MNDVKNMKKHKVFGSSALLIGSLLLTFPTGCSVDFSFSSTKPTDKDKQEVISSQTSKPFSHIEEMFIYGDILFPKYEEKTSIIDDYTKKDLKCLSDNVYHEARGEGSKGMRLVADVTLNRVLSSKYPDSICSVVYQKSQFSWTHNNRGSVISEPDAYRKAKRIATEAIHRSKDTSMGAIHFYAHNVIKPSWAYHKTKTVIHRGHTFLK